jgi:hypothetical protein
MNDTLLASGKGRLANNCQDFSRRPEAVQCPVTAERSAIAGSHHVRTRQDERASVSGALSVAPACSLSVRV